MNFIKFSFQHRAFFFLILFLYTPLRVEAVSFSGNFSSPIIQELPLPGKVLSKNIQDIAFDRCGTMFITTQGFLWVYSGDQWFSFRRRDTPKLIINENNDVFIASDSTLYSLIAEKNRFVLREILYHEGNKRNLKDLLILRNHLLLISDSDISYLEGDNLRFITAISGITRVFPAGDSIILSENGLLQIISPHFKLVPAKRLSFNIGQLLKHPRGFLITNEVTKEVALCSETFDSFRPFLVPGTKILSMAMINDGEYAFLSDSNTIIITDNDGNILRSVESIVPVQCLTLKKIVAHNTTIFLFGDDGVLAFTYPSRIEELYQEIIPGQNFTRNNDKSNSSLYGHDDDYNVWNTKNGIDHFFLNDSIIILNNIETHDTSSFPVPYYPGKNRYGVNFPYYYALSDSTLLKKDLLSGIIGEYSLPPAIIKSEWINLVTGGKKIWIYSSEKIYEFHPNTGDFISLNPGLLPFIKIERLVPVGDKILVAKIIASSFHGEFIILHLTRDTSEYIHLPGFLSPYGQFEATDLDSNFFLISYNKREYKINKEEQKMIDFRTSIFGIIAGEDTLLDGICYEFAREEINKELKSVSRRNNDIAILLGNPCFPGEVLALQYKLGTGDEWSSWKEGKLLHLPNLKTGNYNVSVRIMDPTGRISLPGELSFKIRHSIFLGGAAISSYIILALILGFIAYRRIILSRLEVYTGETKDKRTDSPTEIYVPEPKKFEFDSGSKKESGQAKTRWDKYELATVLFSDIQGFTKIAEQMNPEKLIDDLDQFFFHFDSVVEKYHIEKIKTIGDAYMAAGGIPRKNRSNPVEVVLAALEMQQYMEYMKKTRVDFWDLRIGIHTGPVIAGIVGHKKRSYDIWGDTVNTASRMESSGEAGKVNISGETHKLVKDYFICEYRGKIPVKYKGNLDMYFVLGLRPELSINLESLPNRKFHLKLQLLRLEDLEEFIFDKLNEETPKTLLFHTAEYSRHLYHYAGLLARAENLDMEETLLVLTATLILPVGYLENYFNPEAVASQYAQEILAGYYFSDQQIQQISNLILASRHIPEPTQLLEKVMVDIRHEYLGRADFIKMYKLLFLERNEYQENMEIRSWKGQQIHFLERFEYYTAGAKRLCEVSFEEQIQRIREDDWNK